MGVPQTVDDDGPSALPSTALATSTSSTSSGTTSRSSTPTAGSSWSLEFGGHGSGAEQLAYTGFLTIDQDGRVWVADYDNYRVLKFSGNGESVHQDEGTCHRQMQAVAGLVICRRDRCLTVGQQARRWGEV